MAKGRSLLRWAGILLVCVSVSFVCIEAQGEKEPVKAPESGRPDRIKIDTLAAFGELELPPVTFFHDKHTDVLLKEKKSCETCHAVKDHKLSLAFKATDAAKPAEIKDIYHASCIGCHNEMAAAGKAAGPPDGFCRSCHDAKPTAATARLDVGLNKVLHFRHVESKNIPATAVDKNNCGVCHHDYDKKTKKTFYAKGKEESCRACHGDQPKSGEMSLEQAAHQQCVVCHLNLAQKGVKETGPYVCAGCHGAAGQALVAKKNQEVAAKLPNQDALRIKRGQPDAALITYNPKDESGKAAKPMLMNPVAFDHKAHEKYNDSCRVCHHAGIESCGKCHTLLGAKAGKFVTFEQSMHLKTSEKSCAGCHAAKQAAPNCAGCHNRMVKTARPDEATCKQCHVPLPDGFGALGGNLAATPQQKAGVAEIMLKSRKLNPGTYDASDIPDTVKIKDLTDKYEPAEFAHRKVVQSLTRGMKDSLLAGYFHRDPGTMCQGCHHNSPASKNPPNCSACHGKNFDAKHPDRPGLQAAFHGQCNDCHKDMGLKQLAATNCTDCHKEKQK